MGKLLRCAATLFLLALMTLPSGTAHAQGNMLPESYHGLWAYPHCRTPAEVLLYDSTHVLRATARQATMRPVAVQARADHYLRIGEGGAMYFLERAGERMNRIGLALPNGVWPETLDAANPALRVRSYQLCKSVPASWPSLNEDGLMLYRRRARMNEACADEDTCWRAQFAAADRNSDDLLDYSEIARFWRAMAYMAGLQDQCTFHEIFPGDTSQTGAHFAVAVMNNADDNHDLRLSFEEIRARAQTFLDHETYGPVLRGHLAVLRAYLPSLPAGICADEKTCRPCGRHE